MDYEAADVADEHDVENSMPAVAEVTRTPVTSAQPASPHVPRPVYYPPVSGMGSKAGGIGDRTSFKGKTTDSSPKKRKFQHEASPAAPKTGLASLGIMLDKFELVAAQTTLPGTYMSGFFFLSAQKYTYASTCPDDLSFELGSQTPLPRSCTFSTVLLSCCVC